MLFTNDNQGYYLICVRWLHPSHLHAAGPYCPEASQLTDYRAAPNYVRKPRGRCQQSGA